MAWKNTFFVEFIGLSKSIKTPRFLLRLSPFTGLVIRLCVELVLQNNETWLKNEPDKILQREAII